MTEPSLFSRIGPQYQSYLGTIGEISLTFASIEVAVIQLVCLCRGDDDWTTTLAELDRTSYNKTVDQLEMLASSTGDLHVRERLVDLLPWLRKAGEDRNRYIHATMMMGLSEHGEYILHSVRFRKSRSDADSTVTLSELRGVLMALIETQNMAERLVIDLMKRFAEPAA